MSVMSNQLHTDLEETANRALRIAAVLKHDLPKAKSINERISALEAIARYEIRAKAALAELKSVRGY